MKRRKILFVGMHHSIHVTRWIELISDMGWDLHMFPLDPDPPNTRLKGLTLHWPTLSERPGTLVHREVLPPSAGKRLGRAVKGALKNPGWAMRRVMIGERAGAAPMPPLQGTVIDTVRGAPIEELNNGSVRREWFTPTLTEIGGSKVLAAGAAPIGAGCTAPVPHTPGVLASVIRKVQPDLIHSMEFQHAAYLVKAAKDLYGPGFPKWLATNWGSDIFLFGRQPEHAERIREVLESIDLYSCECHRDVDIAREFGYRGHVLPVLTNTGGFDLGEVARLRSLTPPSKRKVLMIKGYHHFAGRAMTSLKVLEKFADQLKDYQIVLYSVSSEPRVRGLELKAKGVLNIRVIDAASHEEILGCFGNARLYMGISLSDAISTSVLESMAMGAFPIQTNTSCCDEWFVDGEGGFIIPPDDFDLICDRFQRALRDDALVDRAAEINYRTIASRLDIKILKPRMEVFYDEAFHTQGLEPRPGRTWS